MHKTFDFYFDFGSLASYLAWTQLPRLQADTGAQARLRPMLLGGVFQATGNQSPAAVPAKGRYIFTDFDRFARRYGVTLNMNPHFPVNTLLPMRGAAGLLLRRDARLDAYCDAMFQAMWIDGQKLSEPEVWAGVLLRAGFDVAAMAALANEPEVKEQLKLITQEAVQRGVFGAPTFFVGELMFWGQDRIDFVREALK
jgi:2-hydroxychromene-2-carboxylate isomerase